MAARRGRVPPLPIAAEGVEDPYAAAVAVAAAAAAAEDRAIHGPNLNRATVTEELDDEAKDLLNTSILLLNPDRVDKNEYYTYQIVPPELIRRPKFRDEVDLLYRTLPTNACKRRQIYCLLSLQLTGQTSSRVAAELRKEITKDMEVIRDSPAEMQRLNRGRAVIKVKPYLMHLPQLLPKADIDKNKKSKKPKKNKN